MARKKRRKKRSSKQTTLLLDKYKLGGILITIGFLYFFAYFLAKDAPIMTDFFHKGAFFVFGELGTIPFFISLTFLGVLFIFKGHLIRALSMQFAFLLIVLSAIFNFPLIDAGNFLQATPDQYISSGGYASWPFLRILDKMFGGATLATKGMTLIVFVVIIVRIFYTLNVSKFFPSLPKVAVPNYEEPNNNKNKTKSKTTTSSQATSPSLLSYIFRPRPKRPNSTAQLSASQIEQKLQQKLQQATQKESQPTTTESTKSTNQPSSGSNSVLGSVFRAKVKKDVAHKIEEKQRKKINFPDDKPTFSTDLMDTNKHTDHRVDEAKLVEQAQAIQNKLREFDVEVAIDGFDIGPSIIQLRLKLASGVKVATVERLKNDIALSLKTKAMRIVAPIPGTDCIGIQIQNPSPRMVHLGDILDSLVFREAMQSNMTNLTLGEGIDGSIIVKKLDKMPHLLIAGATGSGKSVGVSDFILSLMYQNSPAEMKFLMVDPKQVELEFYSGLPYLLAPIITKPEKALKILQRSVEEMETRYNKLKKNKVKNLEEYNKKIPDDTMYRIVIVIDELADLMMTGDKKEVEKCITRIAQKARAVGMHLIVATQRPSVNVLTGLIKANIPTRIAFGVVSQIDSRTILGFKGAEDLVGKGDLLYTDPNTKAPLRIQAPFVGTEETEKIIHALKEKYMQGLSEEDIYHQEIINMLESKAQTVGGGGNGNGASDEDEQLVQEAISIIAETRKASATMLQRKLNVGFARAARLMDMLEERGIVGPQQGAKPRDILI